MVRNAAAALGIVVFTVTALAQSAGQKPASPFQGKLYRSVFSSGVGVLSAEDLKTLTVAEPLRSRLSAYLTRRAAFKSGYKSAPEDLKAVRSDAKRRDLERSLVALIEAPGIEKTAADFVAAAPIASEWEGLPEGPLAEAAYAENVLKKDPASPLAPWIYVFIAARQRIAFEAFENQKNQEGMKAAAKKYRAFVERARAVSDPVYAALIDDMEAQPFLYIKGTQHPRDHDPDS